MCYRLLFWISIFLLNSHATNAQGYKLLDVKEFEKGLLNKQNQLLDVRTNSEFNSGHLPNALHADFNNTNEFNERINYLDKNRPVYVYCLAGSRSVDAAELLIKKGFKDVYDLDGGITAWKETCKPTIAKVMNSKKGMSETEFNYLVGKEQTVILTIGTKWCPPCVRLNQSIDSLKQEIKNVKFVHLDADDNSVLCSKLAVKKYPAVIEYKLGKQVWRNEGYASKDALKKQLLK